MSKFAKTLVQHATLIDATEGQSEFDLIEEEKHKLELLFLYFNIYFMGIW